MVDYQEIFTRNIKNFSQLSGSLKNSAELTGNADPLLEFLNFVQHITYKEPPKFWQGKYIREFFPPLQCLYEKYGDCDTKCVLLADFLATYPDSKERLAIIIIKGYGIFHTLLAVKRKPLIGMVSLNILGKGIYIPLETTARGWLPGFIGFQSKNCLLKGLLRFETLN